MSHASEILAGVLAVKLGLAESSTEALSLGGLQDALCQPEEVTVSSADRVALLRQLAEAQLRLHDDDLAECLLPFADDPAVSHWVRHWVTAHDDTTALGSTRPLPADTLDYAADTLDYASHPLPASRALGEGDRRFEILAPHAKGGLGEVFLARDRELKREVALKRIQAGHAGSADCRIRFLREAEITGQLEHPGIVPVYALGCAGDGTPYYAMRFVRGQSLRDAIRRFHEEHPDLRSGWRSLEFRDLLGRFVDVCNAVHYAHSRHYLHRDIKPSNVMLGEYGETLVVDWGLARKIGPGSEEESCEPVASESEGHLETLEGAVVGTPAFMSPEQAAGHHGQLDAKSDVYSLGATLYFLLTTRPPHGGSSAADVLARVRAGVFESPRVVKPDVPPALASICIKAMQREPGERYGTAQALAQDVERWLADEPTTTHRESPGETLTRWSRKHKAWTRALTAAIAIVAVASTVALLLVSGAHRLEKSARVAESLAKDEAKRAIDQYVEAVTSDEILDDVRFQPLREKLLASARQFYRDFVRLAHVDRAEVADAFLKLGEINLRSGSRIEAAHAYREAIGLFQKLPPSPARQLGLAQTHHQLGLSEIATGHLSRSQEHFEAAIELLNESPEFDFTQQIAERHVQLVKSHVEVAGVLAEAGRTAQGRRHFEPALLHCRQLLASAPDSEAYRHLLASIQASLARHDDAANDLEAAEAGYREAIDVLEQLPAANPQVAEDLAQTLVRLTNVQQKLGRLDEALDVAGTALTIRIRLAETFPFVDAYRADLAENHGLLADILSSLGRPDESLGHLHLQRVLLEHLTQVRPEVAEYSGALAEAIAAEARLLAEQNQLAQAFERYSQALATTEELLSRSPEAVTLQQRLAALHWHVGATHYDARQVEQALLHYEAAEALCERALEQSPANLLFQSTLASCLESLGVLHRELGNIETASDKLSRAVDLLTELHRQFPDDLTVASSYSATLSTLALTLRDRGKLESALRHFEDTQQINEQILGKNPNVISAQTRLAEALQRGASIRSRLNQNQQAVNDLERASQLEARLAKLEPWSRSRVIQLANTQLTLANLYKLTGQLGSSISLYQECLRRIEDYAAGNDAEQAPQLRQLIAETQMNLGIVAAMQQNWQLGEAAFAQALNVSSGLMSEFPKTWMYKRQLAHCAQNFGAMQSRRHLTVEAHDSLALAIATHEKVLEVYPDDYVSRTRLVEALVNLGIVLEQREQPRDAIDSYHRAIELLDQLRAHSPKDVSTRITLGNAQLSLALALRGVGESTAAREALEQARDELEATVAEHPGATEAVQVLAGVLHNQGRQLAADGELESARASFLEAARRAQELTAADPKNAEAPFLLGTIYIVLGDMYNAAGEPAEAISYFEQALQVQLMMTERRPGSPENHSQLGVIYNNLGHARLNADASDREAVLETLQKGVAEQAIAVRLAPSVGGFLMLLDKQYQVLAAAHRQFGQFVEAADTYAKRRTLWNGNALASFHLARFQAELVAELGPDPGKLPEDKQKIRKTLLERCVKTLQEAAREGFDDWQQVIDLPAFESIRQRPEVAELIKEGR